MKCLKTIKMMRISPINSKIFDIKLIFKVLFAKTLGRKSPQVLQSGFPTREVNLSLFYRDMEFQC